MDLSSLLGAFDGVALDDLMVWSVALLAGCMALIALVNAIEMFIDTEAG